LGFRDRILTFANLVANREGVIFNLLKARPQLVSLLQDFHVGSELVGLARTQDGRVLGKGSGWQGFINPPHFQSSRAWQTCHRERLQHWLTCSFNSSANSRAPSKSFLPDSEARRSVKLVNPAGDQELAMLRDSGSRSFPPEDSGDLDRREELCVESADHRVSVPLPCLGSALGDLALARAGEPSHAGSEYVNVPWFLRISKLPMLTRFSSTRCRHPKWPDSLGV